MADFNQDGISMPADSTVAHGQPSDSQSELSVSRKVKISIVLLLMLCAYFLMEDRPRPDTLVPDAIRTSLTDDSAFVQTDDAQQPLPRESHAGPLTLPDPIASTEQSPAVSSSTTSFTPGLQQNSSPPKSARNTFSGDKSQLMHHQPNPPQPVPAIVRFTGRIETLR